MQVQRSEIPYRCCWRLSADRVFQRGITDLYFIYKSPDLPSDMCVFSVYPCSENALRQTFPRSGETWKNVARIFRLSVFHQSHPLLFPSIPAVFRSPRSVPPCFLPWRVQKQQRGWKVFQVSGVEAQKRVWAVIGELFTRFRLLLNREHTHTHSSNQIMVSTCLMAESLPRRCQEIIANVGRWTRC